MKALADFKHIHCIGIGGIGLSGIAEIFLTRGLKVSGSDIKESDLTIKLRELGALYAIEEIIHQYPHCWRCHEPIVFRATEQWFASVKDMTEQAVKACDDIEWHPVWGKERMIAMTIPINIA